MPDGKKDIPEDELVSEVPGDKPSARRLKQNSAFEKIDEIDDHVGDALDRAFRDFNSDTRAVDDGWITFEEIAASVPPEPTLYSTIRTPLLPPSPGLLIDSQRGDSEEPPALPIAAKKPIRPFSPREAARAREQAIAERMREQKLAQERADEAERVRLLLEQYIAAEPKTVAPLLSMTRQKEAKSLDLDFLELQRIAHGDNGLFDRIDFQVLFRKLSEKYGVERFDTYLLSLLRLQQPLTIPHLGSDGEKWHVSTKAQIETPSLDAPPKVLLFKMDSTPQGKKVRHQHVELVYILQGLSLAEPK